MAQQMLHRLEIAAFGQIVSGHGMAQCLHRGMFNAGSLEILADQIADGPDGQRFINPAQKERIAVDRFVGN